MEKKDILILTGTIDFQIKGNQTLKQTVKYFSKKYRVRMLSFVPSRWDNLDTAFEKGIEDLRVDRLPSWIKAVFSLYVRIQESIFKKRQESALQGELNSTDVVEFFGYNSKMGLILPNLATFLYTLLEFPRAFYYAVAEKPVFIYGYEKEGAFLGALLGRLIGIPVIKRFQGTQLSIKDGKIAHKPFFFSLILSHKIFNYPVVMANDGKPGDEVLRVLGLPDHKFLFIMNGFVPEHICNVKEIDIRRPLGLPEHAKIILMLSTLWMWKRVDRGIYLMRKLMQFKMPEEDFYLLIIGEGNARGYLESLAKRLEVDGKVKFLGGMAHPKALEYLKACDVFWSFYDVSNLGNPLLEAIYLEKPAITIRNKHLESLLGTDAPNLVDIHELDKASELTLMTFRDETFRKTLIEKAQLAKKSLIPWEKRMEKEIQWIEEKIRERLH